MRASTEPEGSVPRYEVWAMAYPRKKYDILTRFGARASAVSQMANRHTKRDEPAYIYDRRRGAVLQTNKAALRARTARNVGLGEGNLKKKSTTKRP